MKRKTACILLAAAASLLSSCTKQEQTADSPSDSSAVESTADDTSAAESSETENTSEEQKDTDAQDTAVLPRITIETVNQDPDVLDFVTEPVAEHVSSQIATWTPGYVMPPAPYQEACKVSFSLPDGTVQIADADADVKVRGNWTTNYEKKPLRIKFAEKQKLIQDEGGSEARNWVLLACYKDASLLRDKTALDIARGILEPDGLYASEAELVEVEINGAYWGVYLLVDMLQVHSDRVDINEPEQDYQGTDIGYLLEFDGYFYNEESLNQFHVDYMDNAPLKPFNGIEDTGREITCLPEDEDDPKKDVGFTIKSDINSQEQHDFIASYVNQVYQIMYHAAYDNQAYCFNEDYSAIAETADMKPQEAVEAVVNVQSLADMYLVSELTCDADIYWSSFYMDVDFSADGDKKLTFEAPWDFDSGLGNKDRCAKGKGFYAANAVPDVDGNAYSYTYETINPWLAVLMYADWYQDIIREKWTAVYDAGVLDEAVQQINAVTSDYADAFKRNDDRWGVSTKDEAVAMELYSGAKLCRSQTEAANYLSEWMTNRVAFMNEKWHQ